MKMTSVRDITVSTKTGHCIGFSAGVPTEVPEGVIAECAAKGCIPSEELEKVLTAVDPIKAPVVEDDGKEAKLVEVIEMMIARNAKGDFTADKLPNTKVLSKETGFKVSVEERNEAWEIVQEGLKD